MSDNIERYEAMKRRKREGFHGRMYHYNTPSDGKVVIGVRSGLGGDIYIVAYVRDTGATRAIKSLRLRPGSDPDRLQALLDIWAKERTLEEVA
jgi:hypothetical protein